MFRGQDTVTIVTLVTSVLPSDGAFNHHRACNDSRSDSTPTGKGGCPYVSWGEAHPEKLSVTAHHSEPHCQPVLSRVPNVLSP